MKQKVLILGLIMAQFTGLAALAAPAGDTEIGGTYYNKIVQLKDVIADVLPPPAYIIESYLVSLEMLDSLDKGDQAKIAELSKYAGLLKDGDSAKGSPFPGYYERINVWKKDLPSTTPTEKKIKDLMTQLSVEPATQFFKVRDEKFHPLVKAGKLAEATQVLRGEMKPLYDKHRKQIDLLVAAATQEFQATEKLASGKAAKGETAELKVRGAIYTKLMILKDLIADVLPPPKYLIESYLVALEAIDAADAAKTGGDKSKVGQLVQYGKLLANANSSKDPFPGYTERQEYWVSNLPEATLPERNIKELMTKLSHEPAKKFYEVRDSKFVPAVTAGNVADAKKVLREELRPLYDSHRGHIDFLVARANKNYKLLESEVDRMVAK